MKQWSLAKEPMSFPGLHDSAPVEAPSMLKSRDVLKQDKAQEAIRDKRQHLSKYNSRLSNAGTELK